MCHISKNQQPLMALNDDKRSRKNCSIQYSMWFYFSLHAKFYHEKYSNYFDFMVEWVCAFQVGKLFENSFTSLLIQRYRHRNTHKVANSDTRCLPKSYSRSTNILKCVKLLQLFCQLGAHTHTHTQIFPSSILWVWIFGSLKVSETEKNHTKHTHLSYYTWE